MIKQFKSKLNLIPVLLVFIMMLSCKDEQPEIAPEPVLVELEKGSNEAINSWIYDQLKIYYYWEEQLPSKDTTDLNPEDYFYTLINTPEDRFSWIQPNYQELLNSLQGINKEAGYEFTLYNDSSVPDGVIGQISYIKKGSPAEEADIQRGDVFTEINGIRLTVDNYQSLLSEIGETHTINILRYNESSENPNDMGSVQLSTTEFAENPNFIDTVYTINDKKIGYYVYNFFATGPSSDDDRYIKEMNQVFQRFKTEGIQHLIVDLRYNSGGAESATINLASLIGSNISSEDIFVKRDFNDFLNEYYNEEFGEDALIRKFESNAANIGSQLENQSVTILTSRSSASASELLINGLMPYMDVFLIGETTYGKNVGSYSIYDDKDPENTWGMQPIVTKSFNSLDQSNYGNGFIPNIELSDNDRVKKELGDINERLLARAIQEFTGIVARKDSQKPKQLATNIYSSLEAKRSFGIYTIELPALD